MQLSKLGRLRNRGDTIIEVLICLAILGFVLSITYSISSRALQTIRRAQERGEALKLAEGQLEQLKSLQAADNSQFVIQSGRDTDEPFCFNNVAHIDFDIPTDAWNSDLNADVFTSYPDKCEAEGAGELYNISIIPPDNDTGGLFTVRVRWDRYGGGAREEVKLEYRLYADN